jgi:hypothetical protein
MFNGCPIEMENPLKVLCKALAADLYCKAGTNVEQ